MSAISKPADLVCARHRSPPYEVHTRGLRKAKDWEDHTFVGHCAAIEAERNALLWQLSAFGKAQWVADLELTSNLTSLSTRMRLSHIHFK